MKNIKQALTAGIGFKPMQFPEVRELSLDGLWLEVHPENYMADGGPRPKMLDELSERHPMSLHGVSMSLAGPQSIDADHLSRFSNLVKRIKPTLVSEHLAWSRFDGRYEPDLLPIIRNKDTLERTVTHILQVQDSIGCSIAVENPSHYLALEGHEWEEIDFLSELVKRTNCQLLIDVTNVVVSANNLGFDPAKWIDAAPAQDIAEIHVAGYSVDPIYENLLIDSHDAAVEAKVWDLYKRLVDRVGPRPTLIERDGKIPALDKILEERSIAHALLRNGDLV